MYKRLKRDEKRKIKWILNDYAPELQYGVSQLPSMRRAFFDEMVVRIDVKFCG